MNANIRNSMLKITMDDGTEIMGRVESLAMTRPIYDSPLGREALPKKDQQ